MKYSSRAKWFDDECREKKQHYTEALKQLKMYKTLETRQVLCDKKTEYKKCVRRKCRVHKFNEMKKIENLRNKRPKDFWTLFRRKKAAKGKDLSMGDFYNYFRILANEINVVYDDEAEQFCSNNDFDKCDPIF